MLSLSDREAVTAALTDLGLDPHLRALIGLRAWQLDTDRDRPLGDVVQFVVVQPGDTLWAIASSRYAGDPREAIWRIKDVNELESSSLSPGTVLRLP